MTTGTGYPAPAPSRPLGVAILAVLMGIYGFLLFLIGLFIVVGSSFFSSYAGAFQQFGVSGVLLGIITVIIGLIILGVAVGLWHLRMWALVLALIVLAYILVTNALAGQYVSLGFIVGLILFIYLLAVNRHFR